jgi:hypothetical protein
MSTQKRRNLAVVGIGGTLYVLFFAYWIGLIGAVPYFNWRYANENGFFSWVAFGEITATGKAVFWPYFAFSGPHTASAKDFSSDHYDRSEQLCEEALAIVQKHGSISTVPRDEASEVADLYDAAATEAGMVRDSYLQQVHPEFLRRYHDDYIGALHSIADGVRKGNQIEEMVGAVKYDGFYDWVDNHKAELKFP